MATVILLAVLLLVTIADSGGSAGDQTAGILNAGGVVQAMRQAAGSNVWASYLSGNSDANIVMFVAGGSCYV